MHGGALMFDKKSSAFRMRKAERILIRKTGILHSDFLNGDVIALAVDGKLHVMTVNACLYAAGCQ